MGYVEGVAAAGAAFTTTALAAGAQHNGDVLHHLHCHSFIPMTNLLISQEASFKKIQ